MCSRVRVGVLRFLCTTVSEGNCVVHCVVHCEYYGECNRARVCTRVCSSRSSVVGLCWGSTLSVVQLM